MKPAEVRRNDAVGPAATIPYSRCHSQARVVADQNMRTRLYRNFQVVFARELPAIPLYYPIYTYGVDQRVQGVQAVPLFEPADRFKGIATWYLVTRRNLEQTVQPTVNP